LGYLNSQFLAILALRLFALFSQIFSRHRCRTDEWTFKPTGSKLKQRNEKEAKKWHYLDYRLISIVERVLDRLAMKAPALSSPGPEQKIWE
jgi:hypothetical protein